MRNRHPIDTADAVGHRFRTCAWRDIFLPFDPKIKANGFLDVRGMTFCGFDFYGSFLPFDPKIEANGLLDVRGMTLLARALARARKVAPFYHLTLK